MIEKTIIINNNSGLHARPAANLSNFLKTFDGDVTIISENQEGDAKSVLNLLSMGISKGAEVTLRVEGPEEEKYIEEIIKFLNDLE